MATAAEIPPTIEKAKSGTVVPITNTFVPKGIGWRQVIALRPKR
jgi:hypothetical protein